MFVDRYYVRKLIYFVMEEHNCKDFFLPPFCKGRQGPDYRGDIIHAGMVSNNCLHHTVCAL